LAIEGKGNIKDREKTHLHAIASPQLLNSCTHSSSRLPLSALVRSVSTRRGVVMMDCMVDKFPVVGSLLVGLVEVVGYKQRIVRIEIYLKWSG
jgi:hypothetical protein